MKQSIKRQQIIKVAKLYYQGNMSQSEIAELMHLSRPKISRMLTEARRLNIVTITIDDSASSIPVNEKKIKDYFGLQYVKIVKTRNTDTDTKSQLGKAASDFLNEHLSNNITIGISWGTTLSAFVNEFQPKHTMSNAKIVQIIGGMYNANLNIDGRELVKQLAQKLDCKDSIIQAPLLVHNPKLKEMFMEEPMVKQHFNMMKHMDIAIIGIGAITHNKSVLYRAGYIEENAINNLSHIGCVGDVCGHFMTADGNIPQTEITKRLISISPEDLQKTPVSVGICEGISKLYPILAAIKGKYINSIIIDEVLALAIITQENL